MNSAQYIKKSRILEHEAAMASVTSKNVSYVLYTMAYPRKTGPGKGAQKNVPKKKIPVLSSLCHGPNTVIASSQAK